MAVLSAVLLMAGCDAAHDSKGEISKSNIEMYDSNADIVRDGDSFSYFTRTGSTTDRITEIDFGGFSGTDTIWLLRADKRAELRVEYSLTVDKGKFKLVLVTPAGQAVNIAEGSGDGIGMITLEKGVNRIKFVGKRTSGKVSAYLKAGDAVKIDSVSDE